MAERVGGFFASLNLMVDEASFRKGASAIKGVASDIGRLVKVGLSLGGLGSIFTGVLADLQAKQLVIAAGANLTVTQFQAWENALKAAGYNADSFVGSLDSLDQRMRRIMLMGENVDQGLVLAISRLGINFTEFMGMNSDQRARAVLQAASGMQNQLNAATLVGDILGDTGRSFFLYMKQSGRSMQDMLKVGQQMSFTTKESKREAMAFGNQLNVLKGIGFEIAGLFSTKLMAHFTPGLTDINQWVFSHKQEIIDSVSVIAEKVGGFIDKLIEFGRGVNDFVKGIGGWEVALKGLAAAFLIFEGGKVISGVVSAFAGLATIATGPVGVALALIVAAVAAFGALEAFNNAKFPEGSWQQKMQDQIFPWQNHHDIREQMKAQGYDPDKILGTGKTDLTIHFEGMPDWMNAKDASLGSGNQLFKSATIGQQQ